MKKLTISERQVGEVTHLVLNGDLIFGEANEILRNSIRYLLNEGHLKIYLDMIAVSYVDSSGIGELISGFTAINRKNGEMRIINLPPKVRQLMVICKLSSIFNIDE